MIILDTHVWHWWTNQIPGRLSERLITVIEEADVLAVSAISCFEMAWLVRHGSIDLGMEIDDWFAEVASSGTVRYLPVTETIARRAVALPEHHKDPQDRIIIATALVHDAMLISLDRIFPAYDALRGRLIEG